MHVMCPWSFISLTSFNCFFKPIKISWSNFYQLHVLQITYIIQLFFKPIRISRSNLYQLHVAMLTLRTHDIMIWGEMNGKLASENFFWKWILRGRRKQWNDCSNLSLIGIEKGLHHTVRSWCSQITFLVLLKQSHWKRLQIIKKSCFWFCWCWSETKRWESNRKWI